MKSINDLTPGGKKVIELADLIIATICERYALDEDTITEIIYESIVACCEGAPVEEVQRKATKDLSRYAELFHDTKHRVQMGYDVDSGKYTILVNAATVETGEEYEQARAELFAAVEERERLISENVSKQAERCQAQNCA